MSHYLVTGAAGFIGARVIEMLLARGHKVVGVDNFDPIYDRHLKMHRIGRIPFERFSFFQADILDPAALAQIFSVEEFSAVFHFAARPGVRASKETPNECFDANAVGTLRVLEAMRAAGVPRLVLASTSSIYAGERPPFTEDVPANAPRSPYAASKKAAEALAYTWHHLYGIDVVVPRYFTVFGPAGRPDMSVLRFIHAIFNGEEITVSGDGSQTRDWSYVDDIAYGTIAAAAAMERAAAEGKRFGYEVINLSGGCTSPVSLNEVIEFLENEIGSKALRQDVPADDADMEETLADISKAERLLEWKPQTSWQDGLRRTVEWYRENAELLANLRF